MQTATKKRKNIKISKNEISFFINNECNLKCKHCYVLNDSKKSLSVKEIKRFIIEPCLNFGYKMFTIIGKEPLLTWDKTKEILLFLNKQREKYCDIRIGLITNGVLLNKNIAKELADLIDELTISFDGIGDVYEKIRGIDSKIVLDNIKGLPKKILDKCGISYTLMKDNIDNIHNTIATLYSIGIRHIGFSQYVDIEKDYSDELRVTNEKLLEVLIKIKEGKYFEGVKNCTFSIGINYDPESKVDQELNQSLIDKSNLFIDKYDRINNVIHMDGNNKIVIFDSEKTAHPLMINHSGEVGICLDFSRSKFYKHGRFGNVKNKDFSFLVYKNIRNI